MGMNKNIVIGVLGGMGTYATVHMFRQYAEVFAAEKEWDRPRIVIDNRCTMPSRVRAFLYHENVDQLVEEMSESMKYLVDTGCNRILLACNTSHLFLPQIFSNVPELKDKVVNIIEVCTDTIRNDGFSDVFLLGSEGTIESGVYHEALKKRGINCLAPDKEEYPLIRECIEAVKQNKYSEETKNHFLDLLNRHDVCVLGCTELPILYAMFKDDVTCRNVYDPLYLALNSIHNEFIDNEENT